MGAQIRSRDWSTTPLGPPHTWTPLFRTSLSILLKSKHPMFLAWGPELLYFYNDAYRPLLGPRHPAVLGMPFADASADLGAAIRPLIDQALSGEGTWSEDLPLVTFRNGREEIASFTFSFSPVTDETGAVAGAFCLGTETTARVRAEAALRAREQRLRSVLEQAPGFMAVMHGPDHVFDIANDAYQRLVGSSDLVGKPVREALPEVVGQGIIGLLDQVYGTGEHHTTNATRVVRDPEPGGVPRERHVTLTYRPLREADGAISGILVQGHDITEQKRIADARHRREHVPNAALRAGRSVAVDLDLTNGRSTRSDTAYELLGLHMGSLSDFVDRVHPDDRAEINRALEGARPKAQIDGLAPSLHLDGRALWQIASEGRSEGQVRYHHPDGRTLWIDVRMQLAYDAAGEPTHMFGLLTDMTEHRNARDALARSEEWHRLLAEQATDMIVRTSPTGIRQYVSPSVREILGYEPQELIGTEAKDYIHPDDVEAVLAARGDLLSGRSKNAIFTYRHRNKAGEWVPLESNRCVVRDHRGTPLEFICFFRDISERLRLEEELRQSQKMEALGQLTGGIAHDFNNLLTVVIGNAEIIADDATDPELRKLSTTILETAERGAELVQHLLIFGRRQTLKKVHLKLADVVQGMLPLLQRTLGENIDLVTQFHPCDLSALTDRALLESAIINLAANARDAMPQGGTLTIGTGQRVAGPGEGQIPGGHDVVFATVTDTGTGISPDILDRVFEPFFTTKEVGKGSGLGLSMVHGFTSQSGGHVSIESRLGKGTSVSIILPAEVNDAVATEPRAPVPSVGGGERVLVVEDDPAVLAFLGARLSGLGYEVVSVPNAVEALALLERDKNYQLLLTDVILPKGISGVELTRAARNLMPGLKVLYTSGYSDEIFRQQGTVAEGIPLLRKPYRRKELAEAVRAVLGSPAPGEV
ncbi:MAG TPA: PAS domain S-box protein [Microvirga sp.]|jgi:PAS domain S-box-containing protein|nr:PAS domain S-box protein [Microvirga sp.]